MPDLKVDELHGERERPARAAESSSSSPSRPGWDTAVRTAVRQAVATAGPRALWRDHRLFTILAVVSLVPRVLAALAFRPALMTSDSLLYMQESSKWVLGNIRPSGYSFFLAPLHYFPHPLLAVTTVQHLMGIAIAAIVYGLLRYWGLPAWGATLAALPTLFDTREIALESYILPDTLFTLCIMLAVALLLTKRTPRLWQVTLAGLLLAYVTVLRANGIPLAVVAAIYLLIRRVGWRRLAAGAAAFAIPVLGYVMVFHSQYGQYNITSSDGMFLWSGTTSFANCAIIKPPADLQPLCPNREKFAATHAAQPAWSIQALLDAPAPAAYLWASDAWWRHDAHPGFNSYNSKLAMRFAILAIKAQPLDYILTSARDEMLVFLGTDRPLSIQSMSFTTTPRLATPLPSYYAHDLYVYAHTTTNTHPVQPYAYFMFLYQEPVYFPGIVFFGVVIIGFVGLIRKRRQWGWGGPAALPWALAAVSLVLPALLKESLYRYAMVAIPLACLAAGLAFVRQRQQPSPAAAGVTSTQAAAGLAAAGPTATAPAATAPVTNGSATTERATTEPASTEPASTEPASTEPASTEPASAEPASTASAASGPPAPRRPEIETLPAVDQESATPAARPPDAGSRGGSADTAPPAPRRPDAGTPDAGLTATSAGTATPAPRRPDAETIATFPDATAPAPRRPDIESHGASAGTAPSDTAAPTASDGAHDAS